MFHNPVVNPFRVIFINMSEESIDSFLIKIFHFVFSPSGCVKTVNPAGVRLVFPVLPGCTVQRIRSCVFDVKWSFYGNLSRMKTAAMNTGFPNHPQGL